MAATDAQECPSIDDVLAYVSRELEPERLQQLDLHLDRCPACRSLVARVSDTDAPASMGDALLVRGDKLGRYEIIEPLGAGGMGIVYAAHDPVLGRRVALKTLRPQASAADAVARLEREARVLAKLSHPNVVAVHDVVQDGPRVGIAMELVEGTRLDAWLATAKPTWREVVSAFAAIGEGLQAAHAAGIVHRDVKPSNILVGFDGRVRIGDFGIARTSNDVATEHVAGTPAFMPPEQARGGIATASSDQFSFCLALYWSLCRRWPPELASDDVWFPRRPRLTARLRATIARGLRRDPAERWASMGEVVARLRRPHPVWRMPVLVTGGVAGAATIAFFAGTTSVPRYASWCDDAAIPIAAWNDEARRTLLQASDDRERVEALVGAFDGYAERLTDATRRACEQAQRHADPRRDVATFTCLDERERLLVRLVTALSTGNIDAAPTSFPLLEPDECIAPDAWLQRQPLPAVASDEELGAVAQARADLHAARMTWGWGDLIGANAALDELSTRPVVVGFPPLATEVDWTQVVLRSSLADVSEDEIIAARYGVVASATESGHSWIAAMAWIELAEWAGPQQALPYVEIARAHVAALRQPDSKLTIHLVQVEARAHRLRGDLTTAARVLAAALSATDDPFWQAVFGDDLAEIQRLQREEEAAVATGAAALAAANDVEGHPPLWHVMLAMKQAMRLVAAGQHPAARALAQESAAWAAQQQLEAFGLGYAQLKLALVELGCGELEAAAAAARSARASFEASGVSQGTTTICDALLLSAGAAPDPAHVVATIVADLRHEPHDDVLDASDRLTAWTTVVLADPRDGSQHAAYVTAMLEAAEAIPVWELPDARADAWLGRQRARLIDGLDQVDHERLERALMRGAAP